LNNPIGTEQIGLSPLDLDLLNSLQADAGMIADLLHYPAILLSGSKSTTFNNYEQAEKALYNNCVIPLLYDLKEGLNQRLGGAFGDKVYIDYDLSNIEVLKPNLAALITAAATANFLTINEKRKMAGYPALVEGGDGFLLSAADIYSATIDEEHEQPQTDTYAADDSAVVGE
jgi:HK97 family phage portal protein